MKATGVPLYDARGYRTVQLPLWGDHQEIERPEYLSRQLITCIGNKRALLGPIGDAIEKVKRRLGKRKLRTFDVFSGSGVVSRLLKSHSDFIVSNDIEDFAVLVAKCFLTNQGDIDFKELSEMVGYLNERVEAEDFPKGFIEELYSPKDENNITPEDRVFYTKRNARRLDNYRRLIDRVLSEQEQHLLIGPLLSEASIHANTAGVFKGFYKNRRTGIGQFGGTGSDALKRILGTIELEVPVLSRFECEYMVLQEDANKAAKTLKGFDLAYIDPPYNQHPYGSNYFMLNLIVNYKRPKEISRVAGIPKDWRRSRYNVRSECYYALSDLLESLDASYLLVSYNNEGFISPYDMRRMLERLGTVECCEIKYNAFRGSRNLKKRSVHVVEQLFLVERR